MCFRSFQGIFRSGIDGRFHLRIRLHAAEIRFDADAIGFRGRDDATGSGSGLEAVDETLRVFRGGIIAAETQLCQFGPSLWRCRRGKCLDARLNE